MKFKLLSRVTYRGFILCFDERYRYLLSVIKTCDSFIVRRSHQVLVVVLLVLLHQRILARYFISLLSARLDNSIDLEGFIGGLNSIARRSVFDLDVLNRIADFVSNHQLVDWLKRHLRLSLEN